ncbi:MAG: peptidoglycan DD-metalloendopeptidase family protein [Candidatus Melainabacteria bacterium]|nr:peptidoglycan DD-metalloendopeptidase family protein [Candidatus Melainabacteria bacterium]
MSFLQVASLLRADSTKTSALSVSLSLALFLASQPLLVCRAAQATSGGKKQSAASIKAHNQEIEKKQKQLDAKREEIHRKMIEVRRKEKLAYTRLHDINHKLHKMDRDMKSSKNRMSTTVHAINQTRMNLAQSEAAAQSQVLAASSRLREIYEGHRLSFLEMILQADSLQQLLDRMYYQERIADQDRALLESMRARCEALAANRNRLDQEKNKLGNLISEMSKKALEMARLKGTQEQTARNLAKQRAFYEQAERELSRQSKQLETQILAMQSDSERDDSGAPHQKGTGQMAMPLKAKLTSPFGWRRHPIFRTRKFHTGIDLAGPRRSPIRASDSGHVLFTGWYGGYGKVVIVSHGKNVSTLYAHLSSISVSKGDNVSKGDILGLEGTTGFATGPHLHFEVRIDGKPKNPLNYVN